MTAPGPRPSEVPRILGRVRGIAPGPTLIAVAAVHGNEPAGVDALRRVLDRLAETALPIHGEVVGLVGNRAALAAGRRFLDHDLNRHWAPERIAALTARPHPDAAHAALPPASAEDRELVELWQVITEARTAARGAVIVVDLHTTSGESPPFVTIGDTLRNRALALALPVPIILGIEEQIDGTLVEYLSGEGCTTLGVEGGRHEHPASADRLAAALWVTLGATGIVAADALDEIQAARRYLAAAADGLPRVVEVRHRHAVTPGDGFAMLDGFASFRPIRAGETLARDRAGVVRARQGGRILMPLYQQLGDDGFFIIREFRPFWLTVSAVLRRVGADRIVHWLPGVRRDARRRDVFVVDRRVARWRALQIFHLLGYRKIRADGTRLVVSRRREPDGGPSA